MVLLLNVHKTLTLRMCQDILDLELWDLTLPPSLGHSGMSLDIPGHLGPGTLGPNTTSRSGTSWDVLGVSQDIMDLGLWDLTLPPDLGHPRISPDIPGHLGPVNLGLNTASRSGTS